MMELVSSCTKALIRQWLYLKQLKYDTDHGHKKLLTIDNLNNFQL